MQETIHTENKPSFEEIIAKQLRLKRQMQEVMEEMKIEEEMENEEEDFDF